MNWICVILFSIFKEINVYMYTFSPRCIEKYTKTSFSLKAIIKTVSNECLDTTVTFFRVKVTYQIFFKNILRPL